jgi:hypothetical protein
MTAMGSHVMNAVDVGIPKKNAFFNWTVLY